MKTKSSIRAKFISILKNILLWAGETPQHAFEEELKSLASFLKVDLKTTYATVDAVASVSAYADKTVLLYKAYTSNAGHGPECSSPEDAVLQLIQRHRDHTNAATK